jgi:uncharacterized protein HemX
LIFLAEFLQLGPNPPSLWVSTNLLDLESRHTSNPPFNPGGEDMDDWNAALRLTSVFAVIAFIALAASVYEIDRREKSSTDTVTASLADLDQQVQLLSNRVRILSNQYARQIDADQRRMQALTGQIEALSNQYETRLKQLEETVRARR